MPYATGSGFWLSTLAAIGSIAQAIAVIGFAKNPALRLIALAIFAIPAVIAATLVHGVTKHMIDSAIVINSPAGSAASSSASLRC